MTGECEADQPRDRRRAERHALHPRCAAGTSPMCGCGPLCGSLSLGGGGRAVYDICVPMVRADATLFIGVLVKLFGDGYCLDAEPAVSTLWLPFRYSGWICLAGTRCTPTFPAGSRRSACRTRLPLPAARTRRPSPVRQRCKTTSSRRWAR